MAKLTAFDYHRSLNFVVVGFFIEVWTVLSGFCFITFSKHTNVVTALHFMAGNQCLLSTSLDGVVCAWDMFRYLNFRKFTMPGILFHWHRIRVVKLFVLEL